MSEGTVYRAHSQCIHLLRHTHLPVDKQVDYSLTSIRTSLVPFVNTWDQTQSLLACKALPSLSMYLTFMAGSAREFINDFDL